MSKSITIDIDDEMIAGWLVKVLESEAHEVEGTISNERVWLKGASDKEQAEIHEENIARLEKYRTLLTEASENLK